MLIQLDDEVLLGSQLAGQLLSGHVAERALLALGDLIGFHVSYFHNYSLLLRRSF